MKVSLRTAATTIARPISATTSAATESTIAFVDTLSWVASRPTATTGMVRMTASFQRLVTIVPRTNASLVNAQVRKMCQRMAVPDGPGITYEVAVAVSLDTNARRQPSPGTVRSGSNARIDSVTKKSTVRTTTSVRPIDCIESQIWL